MRLFRVEGWLESPLNRDVIARWTVGDSSRSSYRIALPQPSHPDHFTILAFGDTGDSDAAGPYVSPQDAVAHEMAADNQDSPVSAILHMGDVVYMTGERRCYDRSFRRPYQPFLTPESTVDHFVFRVPFLPVPGNHDYYDLGVWARFLARVPFLGRGLRALSHQLFTFNLPTGGSGMGSTYMHAFVDLHADTTRYALAYLPGKQTRIPNRYYQAQQGLVDLFGLDSTTLEGPAPSANAQEMKADATRQIQALEERARVLEQQLRRDQRSLENWRTQFRDTLVRDTAQLDEIRGVVGETQIALERLSEALALLSEETEAADTASQAVTTVQRRWQEASGDLAEQPDPAVLVSVLQALDEASDEGCDALAEVEQCLAALPEGEVRTRLLEAHEGVVQALHSWSMRVSQAPSELSQALLQLSDEALDVQRELALERRRLRYRPEDYDSQQLAWLDRSLTEAVRARPDGWRIVYMHHPLYTTISNHCERPDTMALRDNLLEIMRGRVHVVLSGHAHAFEWLRSTSMPGTAFCVTGGGGALSLRPSILDPRRLYRNRDRYDSLRRAGVTECASAGRGPVAEDGEAGPIYHYLRLEVTPDVLTIRPVGIRRLASSYRREQPMMVYHAPELGALRAPWSARRLEAIVLRRGEEPEPVWA
jgi:predicted phosphodiesterase